MISAVLSAGFAAGRVRVGRKVGAVGMEGGAAKDTTGTGGAAVVQACISFLFFHLVFLFLQVWWKTLPYLFTKRYSHFSPYSLITGHSSPGSL
jgi:hypothetical protein